jgi:pyruvate/2-oxoglutarate dehydrogenase complex dihydrolipoamide acyltransferase (E2) component
MNILKEIRVPQESVNDDTVNVVRLGFAHGAAVTAGDVVIELETSKVNVSLEAEVDGFVHYVCKEGDEVAVNTLIVVIGDSFSENFMLAPLGGLECPPAQISTPVAECLEMDFASETVFSAKASELIRKHQIDQSAFAGRDFVSVDDVASLLKPVGPPVPAQERVPILGQVPVDESVVSRTRISKGKKLEIEALQQVQQACLNSMVNIELDTNGLFAVTDRYLKVFRTSLLPLIIYETSRLLLKFPQLNAFYLDQEILRYHHVNIGIAIDLDQGLKTVCLRNASALALPEVEKQLLNMSNKYVDRKLESADLNDITFTITDLSAEGIHFFTPLINQRNAAILGIAAPKRGGAMVLSLTFDHRVTEGKTASRFLRELKERLEDYKNKIRENTPDFQCFKCHKKLSEDFSDFGFLKVVNKLGEEANLCQTCFKGL